MKKLSLLLLGLSVLVSSVIAQTELITNGGFESGLDTWTIFSCPDATIEPNDGTIDPVGPAGPQVPISGSGTFDCLLHHTGVAYPVLRATINLPAEFTSAMLSWDDRIFCNGTFQRWVTGMEVQIWIAGAGAGNFIDIFSTGDGPAANYPGPNHRSFDIYSDIEPAKGEHMVVDIHLKQSVDGVNLSVFLDNFSLIVEGADFLPPEITCPGDISQGTDNGLCSADIAITPATATDDASLPENIIIEGVRDDGLPLADPYPVGVTTITWTATDEAGYTAECGQTITVNDTEPPVVTCPDDITVSNDPDVCCAVVEFPPQGIETGIAESGITLEHQGSGLTGVAFNPDLDLYYGVWGGNPSFTIYTYDIDGNLLATNPSGWDSRGLWWNPNTSNLEANGFNSQGYHLFDLDGNGYALSTGITDPSSNYQPSIQSQADYDYDTDEVIYYYSGIIYRTSRSTGLLLGSYPITGLPAITINWTFVGYTGYPGAEIMVYDYDNKVVYLIDKSTGAYSHSVQLPGDAPGQDYVSTSYANGYIWINNSIPWGPGEWVSYKIINSGTSDNCGIASVEYSPESGTCFPVGTTEVTMTVTDIHDNESECSFTVMVQDLVPPTIVCPADITFDSDPGECTLSLTAEAIGWPAVQDNTNCTTVSFSRNDGQTGLTDAFHFGLTQITWTVIDEGGNSASCIQTIDVPKIRPFLWSSIGHIVADYSDEVTLSAYLDPYDCPGINTNPGLATGWVDFYIVDPIYGEQLMGTVVLQPDGTASWIGPLLEDEPEEPYLEGVMIPGLKDVRAEFRPDPNMNYRGASMTHRGALEITQEDADVAYVGVMLQATAAKGILSADVKLMATVQDALDGYPGDIRNACVTFELNPGGPAGAAEPMELVAPLDPTLGVATLNANVPIGVYTVEVYVDCYYVGSTESVLTVYEPDGDFITGGGYIIPDNSYGTSSLGTIASNDVKWNYGFNVKYNKKGKKLKGHVNIITRTDDGGIFQIKSNAMASLGVDISDPDKDIAVYTAKANLKELTPNGIINKGNLILMMTITDRGEPGVDDEIGITLWSSKGGNKMIADELLLSSDWNGMETVEQYIAGGNLVVHSGFSTKIGHISDPLTEDLFITSGTSELMVYPNPFSERTSFEFQAATDSRAKLVIYDAIGRALETLIDKDVNAGQLYRLDYQPGNIANGILFYTLTIDNEVKTGKIIHRR